ncbi:MAG: hydrogenase maturation protease [Candidatus Hecatellaceae archaeon]
MAGDDGVGVYAAKKLAEQKLPPNVEVVEAGTPGLNLISLLEGADAAIIVDALKLGKPKGSIHRLDPKKLETLSLPLSAHELGVAEALKLGFKLFPEKMPKHLVIIGVEVGETTSFKVGLSPEVERALPKLIEEVLREAERLLKVGGPEGI